MKAYTMYSIIDFGPVQLYYRTHRYHGQVCHRQHPERVDVPEQSVVRQKLAQREQGEGGHKVHLHNCWFYKVDCG